jgi:hypothetical protein
MPIDWKNELGNEKVPQRTWLKMPVIGMEAEFNVYLDGQEIIPEKFWSHPSEFIDVPLLARTEKSSQLPTGGAVYFDRGVIEVVTPVIEIAPGCTARVVRNLWEQMGFVRDQLTSWEKRTGHNVRLKAYSAHYNISFELPRSEQNAHRNIQKLALLLAYILPFPVALVGGNRRSTGVGVRPRGNRIEVTVDFTPDPGLTIATATLIVPIVREILSWPSYDLSLLDHLPIPTIAGVVPGKHTTRKGWLTKDFHYPQSPFTSDVNAPIWKTRDGRTMSLRAISLEVAWFFRRQIRKLSDPFSFRLLFAILTGKTASMLELSDRPAAYEDVGRLCRWGMVIAELKNQQREQALLTAKMALWDGGTLGEFVENRQRERSRRLAALSDTIHHRRSPSLKRADALATKQFDGPSRNIEKPVSGNGGRRSQTVARSAPRSVGAPRATRTRHRSDTSLFLPPRKGEYLDRRMRNTSIPGERRQKDRRARNYAVPFPDRRLTRSAYEQVFLKLVSGSRLRIGRDAYRPVGMKGWYHAIFRRESDGKERLLTIDQLLKKMTDWQS